MVTIGLKTRPGRAEISVALGVAAVYLMVLLRMTLEERSHLFEYSIVAVLIYEALTERARHGRHVPAPGLVAILVTALAGAIDESIQAALPNRVFDIQDIGFNALAGLIAVAASIGLARARRLGKKRGRPNAPRGGP